MDLGQFFESLEKLPCALCHDVITSTRLSVGQFLPGISIYVWVTPVDHEQPLDTMAQTL
jgi:hypothetical protein